MAPDVALQRRRVDTPAEARAQEPVAEAGVLVAADHLGAGRARRRLAEPAEDQPYGLVILGRQAPAAGNLSLPTNLEQPSFSSPVSCSSGRALREASMTR